jgi:hypothetical protein
MMLLTAGYVLNCKFTDNEWVPTNLDSGHLDAYFLVLAALMGLTMVYFYYISKNYEYKTDAELNQLENEEEHDIQGDGSSSPDYLLQDSNRHAEAVDDSLT